MGMDIGQAAVTTISVFGSLCSIYSVFMESGKADRKKVNENLRQSIMALDLFKETHTKTQILREYCHTIRTDTSNFGKTDPDTFLNRLNDFRDKFSFFVNHKELYQEGSFDSVPIDTNFKQLTPHLKKALMGVTSSVNLIKSYLPLLEGHANQAIIFADNWDYSNFNSKKDSGKIVEIVLQTESPARNVLLAADHAILNSITILSSLTIEML